MRKNSFIEYSSDVKKSLEKGKPVVGLETAAVTGAMPWPQNFETAKKLCEIVRAEGAVPAFIAVIGGKMKAGLSETELEYLCKAGSDIKKASRSDLAMLAAAGEDGSAAPSGALAVAKLAGIKVLAVGGIGGVHRGTNSMDPDIEELAAASVLTISAGPDPVLDAVATAEQLDAHGVAVVGYGTGELPAFYTLESGVQLEYTLSTPAELAKAFHVKTQLRLPGGLLAVNPVPAQYAVEASSVGRAIDIAVEKASELGVKGRELTPFLTTLIMQLTAGKPMQAGAAALCGNARLAAQAAVVLSAISDEDESGGFDPELIAYIKDKIADDVEEELEDEMEEELEENINKEMKKAKEELRTEVTEMLSAYALSGKIAAAPKAREDAKEEKVPEKKPSAPADEDGPILDDRPFIPFVPGQKNEQHGPAEPEKKEYRINPEYMADPEQQAEAEAEEPKPEAEPEEAPEPTPEEPAAEAEAEEEEAQEEQTEAEEEFTVYDPNAYRQKREAEQEARAGDRDAEPAPGAPTEYNPEEYRQRALERKRRMAIASGEPIPEEAKTAEDIASEAAALVDCKGPLEFTGEHPLAWKCTRCGQVFEKHEIPHKRPKTPQDD